jgi:hypothetical protein
LGEKEIKKTTKVFIEKISYQIGLKELFEYGQGTIGRKLFERIQRPLVQINMAQLLCLQDNNTGTHRCGSGSAKIRNLLS